MTSVRRGVLAIALVVGACSPSPSPGPTTSAGASGSVGPTGSAALPTGAALASPSSSPLASRRVFRSQTAITLGSPIAPADLSGRIVFDDFEDVFAMHVDGTGFSTVAGDPAGPEFDGAWSPDAEWIVYRDSTRGINDDDEIFIARPDGSERRNLTNDPGNDWGPDWSPDGSTIAFNSDRAGGGLRGYLVAPDGTNLRRMPIDAWVEYPSFSPDGTKVAFMGARGANYDVFVGDLASGAVTQLTEAPGQDGWPAWSPDGSTIAFTSVRDDCGFAPRDRDCWQTGDVGPHFDIWLVNPDGSNQRRVTPEFGQFVAWSPDSQYVLVSGYALFVVRLDGTGRLELRSPEIGRALGGIPDWIEEVDRP